MSTFECFKLTLVFAFAELVFLAAGMFNLWVGYLSMADHNLPSFLGCYLAAALSFTGMFYLAEEINFTEKIKRR